MSGYSDRVNETTTTTGTGNIILAGAQTGYQAFQTAFPLNVPFGYCIQLGTEFEVGVGYLSGSTTLVRNLVLSSSNAGALVNFSAGTKNVFCTQPAATIVDIGTALAINTGYFLP